MAPFEARYFLRPQMRAFAVLTLAALAGCAPTPKPGPVVVAPVPKTYTCEQSRAAAAAYAALPAGSALKTYVDDYGLERRELRAVLGLPDPPKCP